MYPKTEKHLQHLVFEYNKDLLEIWKIKTIPIP